MLADQLDNLRTGEEFDMTRWPTCIGGWALRIGYGRTTMKNPMTYAADYLDLSEDAARELFDPFPMIEATAHQAAQILRNLLRTGRVDWSIIKESVQ